MFRAEGNHRHLFGWRGADESWFIAGVLFEIHECPLLLFTPGQLGFISSGETKEQRIFFQYKKSNTNPAWPKTFLTVNWFYVPPSGCLHFILLWSKNIPSRDSNAAFSSQREVSCIYGESWQFDFSQDVLHVNECSCNEFLKVTASPR